MSTPYARTDSQFDSQASGLTARLRRHIGGIRSAKLVRHRNQSAQVAILAWMAILLPLLSPFHCYLLNIKGCEDRCVRYGEDDWGMREIVLDEFTYSACSTLTSHSTSKGKSQITRARIFSPPSPPSCQVLSWPPLASEGSDPRRLVPLQ
jgi:hypothetical protein